jgi:CheY-like chemotaxis protein
MKGCGWHLGARLRKEGLLREGYIVDSVADGKSAFPKATSQPFDVIILDIMLPGRGGLDVCRDIWVQGAEIPILLLTARGEIAENVLRKASFQTYALIVLTALAMGKGMGISIQPCRFWSPAFNRPPLQGGTLPSRPSKGTRSILCPT